MKRVLQFTFAAMMFFVACSKEDETPPPLIQDSVGEDAVFDGSPSSSPVTAISDASKYKVSEDEAIRNLNAFLSMKEGGSLSKSSKQVRIVGISAFRIKSSNTLSKSLNTEEEYASVGVDTLMYAVNFADSMGFALMAADRRTAPIFAIADQGNIDFENIENEENEGLLIFLDGAIDKAVYDIANFSDTVEFGVKKSLSKKLDVPNIWSVNYHISPLLQTRWGQDNPYNYYCGGCKVGCVATAIAQIFSYYQNIGNVSWNYNGTSVSAYLNWTKIIKDCNEHNGCLNIDETYTSAVSVACLCRYLGFVLNADYGESKTSINSGDAINWIKNWSPLDATDLSDFNLSSVTSALCFHKIVYARGYREKKKHWIRKTEYKHGHAWVIDGFISAINKTDNKTYWLVHCNWGWDGRANGFYLSDAFDVHSGPIIQDSYGSSGIAEEWNYQYKLQYSIISKK